MAGQLASFFVYIGRYMYIHDIYGGVSLAVAQELVRCRLVCLSLVTFAYLSFMQMRVNFNFKNEISSTSKLYSNLIFSVYRNY